MRIFGISWRELFERIEREALKALPAEDWEFPEWRRARVNLDYHVEVHDFFYSVPHAVIRAEVSRVVEAFYRGQPAAVHQRRCLSGGHGTNPEHVPSFQAAPLLFKTAGSTGPSRDRFEVARLSASIGAQNPQAVRNPCSRCCLLASAALIRPSVLGPILSAHRRNRSGVHST